MADEDRELFASAISEEPTAPVAAAEPPAPAPAKPQEQDGRPRDVHGRFAPKATDAPAQTPVQQQAPQAPVQPGQEPQRQPDDVGHIPAWRLREEAEARRQIEQRYNDMQRQFDAVQRQLAEFQQRQQPKPEPPNIFENPEGYQSHIEQLFNDRLNKQAVEFSLRLAKLAHKEAFDEAYQAALQAGQMGDRATINHIMNSPDPGEAMVRWHRQQKLYAATNGDLEGYLAKKQDELLNDPAFLAKAAEKIRAAAAGGQSQPTATNITRLPPSLNRLPSSAPSGDDGEDLSDAGLLKSALRR